MELSFSPDAKKGKGKGIKLQLPPTYDLPPGCSVAPGYQKKTKKRPGKVETNTTHMFVCEDAKDE
jgi:hypothetical protein